MAATAGVDSALVHHFFGTKEKLFIAALELPIDPALVVPAVLEGGPKQELGRRLVGTFLAIWADPSTRAPFLALIRSAMTHEDAARMLREFLTSALLGRLATSLSVPRVRVTAAAAQLVGLVMLRYVIRIEPLASASDEEIVELFAPVIQRYLVPE